MKDDKLIREIITGVPFLFLALFVLFGMAWLTHQARPVVDYICQWMIVEAIFWTAYGLIAFVILILLMAGLSYLYDKAEKPVIGLFRRCSHFFCKPMMVF